MQRNIIFFFALLIGFFLINQSPLIISAEKSSGGKPLIKKIGTIDCDMVEVTPIVFKGRLYRFEYVRENYKPNKTGNSYFRFINVQTGKSTPLFAAGYHLGCAYVQNDTVFVYGVNKWGESNIQVFWSKDLNTWSSKSALNLKGWGIYNTSVCKDSDRYIMAFEVGEPPEVVGVRFTMRFAESTDLINWKLMPDQYVYSKERYTACPALRFIDGFYYMIFLEAKKGPVYAPYVARSKNLTDWQLSHLNPVMDYSPEDKIIANPNLTHEQRQLIAKAVDINNSDVDLCEFNGKVIIYYSWGNQQGNEFLAQAVYDGTLKSFLQGFFPEEEK